MQSPPTNKGSVMSFHAFKAKREGNTSIISVRSDADSIQITIEGGRDVFGRVTITPKELDMIVSHHILKFGEEMKGKP